MKINTNLILFLAIIILSIPLFAIQVEHLLYGIRPKPQTTLRLINDYPENSEGVGTVTVVEYEFANTKQYQTLDEVWSNNSKDIRLSNGETFKILVPVTNMIATNACYEFEVQYRTTKPEEAKATFPIKLSQTILFHAHQYVIKLNKHIKLIVKRQPKIINIEDMQQCSQLNT